MLNLFHFSTPTSPFSQWWGLHHPTLDHHTHPCHGQSAQTGSLLPYVPQMPQKERQKMWQKPEVQDDKWLAQDHTEFQAGLQFCSPELFHHRKWSLIQPGSVPMLRAHCTAMPTVGSSWWEQYWLLIPAVLLFPNDHRKMLSVHFPSNWAAFTLPKIILIKV